MNLDILPYLEALIPFAIAAITLKLLKAQVFETSIKGATAPSMLKLYNYISILAYTLASLIALYMVTGVHEALYAAIAIGLVAAAPLAHLLLNAYYYVVLLRTGVIAPGERIEVDGVKGSVHSIGLYATIVRTEGGELVAIPNHLLAEKIISKKPIDRRRIDVHVRLHNIPRTPTAIDEALMKLRKTISEFKAGIRGLETTILITGFEGDTLTALIRVYTVGVSAATISTLISRIITSLSAYKPDVRIEPHD